MSSADVATTWPSKPPLASEQYGLQGLTGANDWRAVARRHKLIQRSVFEIAREQPREPFGRQMDLLEEVRLTRRKSQSLEIERRRARLQRRAAATATVADSGRAEIRRVSGSRPRSLHLVGEARSPRDVAIQPRSEDEGAAATGSFDATLAHQLVQCATDGDQTAAVMAGELTLRRELAAWRPASQIRERRAGRDRPDGAAGRGRARAGTWPTGAVLLWMRRPN